MRFSIEKFTPVMVRSVNIRSESHGKDLVPAVDIGFVMTCSNRVLDQIESGRTIQMYKAVDAADPEQENLDGVETVADLPELRTHLWEMPMRMKGELAGRNVVIDYGTGGKSNIELSACTVNEFKADCKQGGTVDLYFRVQCSGVTEKVAGKLAMTLKHEVSITMLSSPEADGTQEVVGGGSPFKFTAEGGDLIDNASGDTATDIFVEQHGEPSASELGLSENFASTNPEEKQKPKPPTKKAKAK